MKSRIASDNLSWLNLSLGTIPLSDLHRQKKTTRAILRRLYDKDGVPGVILADEVGMGKTYVALGVAAAIFSNYGQGKKVIVLAPGRQMQRVWWQRWEVLRQKQHSIRLPEGHMISDMREAGEGISFGSYEEMKHTTGGEILAAYRQASRGKDRPRGIVRRRLRNSLFEAYGISVPS